MGEVGVQPDLAAWLLQQLLADQVVAEHALQDWMEGEDGDEMAGQPDSILVGAHLVRWNPRRVLVECDTKRRIIEMHQHAVAAQHQGSLSARNRTADETAVELLGEALREMAVVYKDRDGYRAEWAPDGRA